jgi:hypothetical protein
LLEFSKVLKWKYFFRPSPHPQGAMWEVLVASRCIFILITTLLDRRNTATTKKLDFKNSKLTSVGATFRGRRGKAGAVERHSPYSAPTLFEAIELLRDGRFSCRISAAASAVLLQPFDVGQMPRVVAARRPLQRSRLSCRFSGASAVFTPRASAAPRRSLRDGHFTGLAYAVFAPKD